MRESHSAWASFSVLVSVLAMTASLCFAGQDAKDADKEKPKERPFKYDAWCAFSDLMVDRPYVSPNAPIDPETEHVRVGVDKLGGFGRRGQWAHVVVDLKNTTDPKDKINYEGTSTIELNHFKPDDMSVLTYMTSFRQAFQVAPQTEKPYHFSLFCPENGWNSSINAEIMTSSGRPYNRDFKLYDLDERGELLIVVVSDQPGAFKFLGPRMKNRDESEMLPGGEVEIGRQIASVTPSELPTRWHDLTLASLIIIDGPPSDSLSPAQWEAIKSYAQSGGKVLIMAGKDPNRLKGAIEELAGIVVRASTELPSLDQFDTKFPASADKSKAGRVPVIEVTAPGAGIVKRNSATQIVEYCAKSYGAGMIAFIPFSLSDRMFEGWPERFSIPMNLVKAEKNLFAVNLEGDDDPNAAQPYNGSYGYGRAVKHPGLDTLRNSLDGSLQDDTPVEKQSPRTVLWFMIVYLFCAVPLNFLIFTALRRRETGWLAAPVWALAFTIAAYYISYSGHTGAVTVNEVSVVEAGSGQDTGIGRTFMGVYTPRRDDYQIQFPPLQLTRENFYDTQAAPTHLINTQTIEKQGLDFPSMRIRESGQSLAIEQILILNRSTRRFEVQHRAWLGGGVDLRFVNSSGDKEERPQVLVRNNVLHQIQKVKLAEQPDLSAITFLKSDAMFNANATQIRKWIEDGTVLYKDDGHVVVTTEKGRADVLRSSVATVISGQSGSVLHSPVFVKNGYYLEFDSGGRDLGAGQTWDTRNSNGNWRPLDDLFLEHFSAHFRDAGLDNKHIADRAGAVGTYLKNHLKQYVAGVFIAWTDGAALPVEVGPTGGKLEEPLIDGITLLVIPAAASNRGRASYKLDEPKVYYATAYSPEVSTSGEWKPCGKDRIPIRTPVDATNKCVYLRLKFDRDFGQYVYKNKAAQLTFSLSYKGVRNAAAFNGEVSLFARLDAARNPAERFKLLEDPTEISAMLSGTSRKIQTKKIPFTSTELFTGSSIILKIQPKADDGAVVPDTLVLENVDLQLVDR